MLGILNLLTALAHPVGFFWALLVTCAVVFAVRKRRREAILLTALALLFWILGNGWIASTLLGRLERPQVAAAEALEGIEPADCVIVLGGGQIPSEHDPLGLDLTPAGERLFVGLHLVKSGKAGTVVVSGFRTDTGHASSTKRMAEGWGVSGEQMIVMRPCRNTRDEALEASRLMEEYGWKSVVLVTSAFHMERSLATFRKVGIEAIPAPCDFRSIGTSREGSRINLVPTEEALSLIHVYIHEVIGRIAYKARDWN